MLKISPFHSRTAPLVRAQTWRRWAGYQMASAYDPHPDREYAAIRSAAALIDVSPLHKYMLAGRDSARLLDRMITRDMTKCSVGQVYYTPWCDAAGKVIDDGTVSRALVNLGAIGLVTTHDLALTELPARLDSVVNMHFEDRLDNGRMVFDYRMRPGVVEHSNALALMRAIGLDV